MSSLQSKSSFNCTSRFYVICEFHACTCVLLFAYCIERIPRFSSPYLSYILYVIQGGLQGGGANNIRKLDCSFVFIHSITSSIVNYFSTLSWKSRTWKKFLRLCICIFKKNTFMWRSGELQDCMFEGHQWFLLFYTISLYLFAFYMYNIV